ncbi:MAG: VCBS repeat-containing protein [Muribaculaceae bacterium]|nr:VCBS repeat-containing protein [Muribaculaceae bacterium]
MKRFLLGVSCLALPLFTGFLSSELYGQTSVTNNVKFSKAGNPVPGQPLRDSYQGAGDFYHAQYTGSAWGDYNNDGYLDLYYSDRDEHVGSSIYSNLYTNNQDGTFTRQASSKIAGAAFSSPLWLDINNDGLLDLILPGLSSWGYNWADHNTNLDQISIAVYINQGPDGTGNYTFEKMENPNIRPLFNGKNGGKGHNWISAGDYDNDGYIDIVMTGFDEHKRFYSDEPEEASRAVYLYRNNKGNGFELQEKPLGDSNFLGLTDGSVEFVDLDGDGYLDLFTTGYGSLRTSEAYVYWNNGDGTFTADKNYFKGISDSSTTVYDLDNDGLPELIMPGKYLNTNSKTFIIYHNLGNRKFELLDNLKLEGIDGGQISVGDVNNDGYADILVGGHGQTHEHTTWLYLNNGDFTFTTYGAYYDDIKGTNSFSRVTHGSHHLVDYDNDGFLDAWMSGWVNGSCAKGCGAYLYHNDSSSKGALANSVPSAPENLKATIGEGGKVKLEWSPSSDKETPGKALRYNVFLRRIGSDEISMTVPAHIETGLIKVNKINGEIRSCAYNINLSESGTYEWGVQAIDNANAGGLFTTSQFSIEVDPELYVEELNVEQNLNMSYHDNRLDYLAGKKAHLNIISLQGVNVASYDLIGSGSIDLGLDSGIYVAILSDSNESIKMKIIVR